MASTQYFFLIFPTEIIFILYIFDPTLYAQRDITPRVSGCERASQGLIFNEIKGNDETLSFVARFVPPRSPGGGSRSDSPATAPGGVA
jgi:hypothetical protein